MRATEPCSQGAGISGKTYLRKGRKTLNQTLSEKGKRDQKSEKKPKKPAARSEEKEDEEEAAQQKLEQAFTLQPTAGLWWGGVTVRGNKQQQQELLWTNASPPHSPSATSAGSAGA